MRTISDTWITDIRHFLDDQGLMPAAMPGPARKMAEYMGAIIEAATARPAGETWAAAAAAAPCRCRPARKACPGRVIVRRVHVPAEIEWRRWRIVEMKVWGRDYLDMEVEAFIELGMDNLGSFQFGLVRGDVDYVVVERDGRAAVEWSWVGVDEDDEVSGRGWAVVNGDKLDGRIFIHRGDQSAFLALRSSGTR